MATDEKPTQERDYGKIVLTLENVLVPEDKLNPTPSITDGLDAETEMDLRILGCELIQMSGILLKLPQVAMATGQVLYQRFYFSKSFVKHNMEVIAMACVNLASKIEEAPRRIRDVINVFHHIKQVRCGKSISPLILNQDYINLKNQVIKGERRILKELGFCVHVKHPHKIIVMYLQVLEAERNQSLVQKAWNYMNDSFRTDVFVRFHPETIAVACIFLAARQTGVCLPSSPPWYEVFGTKLTDLETIALQILALYKRTKPNAEKLEEAVNEVKKLYAEAKKKAKGDNTPNSRAVSPGNMDSPLTTVKKLKGENDHNSDNSFGHRHRGSHSRSRSRTPRSITNSRSYHSSSRSPASRSRSRSPNKHHHRHRHRRTTPAKKSSSLSYKSKSRSDKYDRVSDKYHSRSDKYSSRDRSSAAVKDYDYDGGKYYSSSKKASKRRSVSYSPSPPRRSFSPASPERRHKKKDRRASRSPYDHRASKKAKKHSNGHRDRSRSRDRHRR